MPRIYRFDLDSTGIDSIQSYVDQGSITNIPCPSFPEFDAQAAELLDKINPGDVVIVDTVSAGLETTRGDMMLGDSPTARLWEQADKFYGDKHALNIYRGAQTLMLRRIKNFANRGVTTIVLAHQAEAKDYTGEVSGRIAAPMVNPAMVDDLIAACSDVFMLRHLIDPVYEGEREVIPAGKRVLYLRRTHEYTAKFHVDPMRVNPDHIPAGIIEPTMEKLCAKLRKIPRCLCIYGHPGAGKTTLAASIVNVVFPNVAQTDATKAEQPRPTSSPSFTEEAHESTDVPRRRTRSTTTTTTTQE
jgi:hypothetical protein